MAMFPLVVFTLYATSMALAVGPALWFIAHFAGRAILQRDPPKTARERYNRNMFIVIEAMAILCNICTFSMATMGCLEILLQLGLGEELPVVIPPTLIGVGLIFGSRYIFKLSRRKFRVLWTMVGAALLVWDD